MATYRITAPDGSTYDVTAPDDASEEDVLFYAKANYGKAEQPQSMMGSIAQGAGNLAAGAVRGAGSIGATLMYPIDKATDLIKGDRKELGQLSRLIVGPDYKPPLSRNEERRQAMDEALASLGADPNSWMYKGGKLAGEIAGTAGAGGALAQGARALGATRALSGLEPVVEGVARGLQTGGFRVGPLAGTGLGTVTRLGTGALVGGTAAGMVNPEDAGVGALIGGALPGATQLAGKAGGAIRNAVVGQGISPEVRQLAQRAQELGINIPADRIVNSRPLNAAASSLNYVPFSGRAATEDAMSSQLNQALSKTFGQNSSNVTMALRKADDVLGNQFDDFLRSNTVKMTPRFDQALNEAAQQADDELGTEAASIIRKQIATIRDKAATGEIDGQAAYNIKKTLDRIGKRNSAEAWYALDLKGKLMDALNDSVGTEKAQSFAKLRQQYGNMLSLQKVAKNGAEGEISAARLGNMGNIRNPDVQELADIAAQFVKSREAPHGAAQRVYGAGGLLGTGAVMGGPLGALTTMAAGSAAGRGANTLLNSQMARNFVMNRGLIGEPEALGLLTQGAYRALPLIPAQ